MISAQQSRGGRVEGGPASRKCRRPPRIGSSFAAGVLSDCLGSLADGVLAQLPGKVEADGGLDLAAGDSVLLVVVRQARGLGGDALEDVVHERVHDAHGLAGDAGVGVNLPQNLVDIDGIAFFARLPPVLAFALGLGGRFFLAFLARYFPGHGGWLRCLLRNELTGYRSAVKSGGGSDRVCGMRERSLSRDHLTSSQSDCSTSDT